MEAVEEKHHATDMDLRGIRAKYELWLDCWKLQRRGTALNLFRTGKALHRMRQMLWDYQDDPVQMVRVLIGVDGGTSRVNKDPVIGVELLVLDPDSVYYGLFDQEDRNTAAKRLDEAVHTTT